MTFKRNQIQKIIGGCRIKDKSDRGIASFYWKTQLRKILHGKKMLNEFSVSL